MKTLTCLIILPFVCLVGISAQAQTPLELYDDFNSEFMDIGKWWTAPDLPDSGVVILESVREIHGGRLHMMCRAFGNINPLYSGVLRGEVNSYFGMGKVFQGLKVSIKVNDIEVTGCPDTNTTPSNTRARLVGFFFNAVKSTPTPGNRTDDILAQVRIFRRSDSTDKPQVLEVLADVTRCPTSACPGPTPDSPATVLLGKINLGQWATIEIDWDKDNQQFYFSLNNLPTVSVLYPSGWKHYPVSSPLSFLGASNRIANCPSADRALAFVEAEFDNLFVKELSSP
jgi:hypothetical protein